MLRREGGKVNNIFKRVRLSTLQLQQISIAFEYSVSCNLWFVRAIGCNVKPMVEPNHTFPANRKKHSNAIEICCIIILGFFGCPLPVLLLLGPPALQTTHQVREKLSLLAARQPMKTKLNIYQRKILGKKIASLRWWAKFGKASSPGSQELMKERLDSTALPALHHPLHSGGSGYGSIPLHQILLCQHIFQYSSQSWSALPGSSSGRGRLSSGTVFEASEVRGTKSLLLVMTAMFCVAAKQDQVLVLPPLHPMPQLPSPRPHLLYWGEGGGVAVSQFLLVVMWYCGHCKHLI